MKILARLWRLIRSWFAPAPEPQLEEDTLMSNLRDIQGFMEQVYGPWLKVRGHVVVFIPVDDEEPHTLGFANVYGDRWFLGQVRRRSGYEFDATMLLDANLVFQDLGHGINRDNLLTIAKQVDRLIRMIHKEQERDHQAAQEARQALERNFLEPKLFALHERIES